MLLGTLGVSLLGNILAGIGVVAKSISEETKWTSQERGANKAGEREIANSVSKETKSNSVSEETKSRRKGREIVRAGYGNKKVRKITKNKNNF